MISFRTSTLSLLLIGITAVLPAAEPQSGNGAIEVQAGQTVYFQLADSTPDRNSAVVRVENPHRDYGLVKLTFETGADGTGTLRIHNGYSDALALQMNEACPPQNMQALVRILRPGSDSTSQWPASVTRVVLCNLRLMGAQAASPPSLPSDRH